MNEFEAEVLATVLQDAGRPLWMPTFIYSKLTQRAGRWTHVLALQVFNRHMTPLFEQHSERIRQEIKLLRSDKD